MHTIRLLSRATLLTLLLLGGLPAAANPGFFTHTVTEGESVATLAEQFLGDAALAGELALFNDLASPDDIRPGMRLLIPRELRAAAIARVEAAARATAAAEAAKADTYAADLFTQARTMLESARHSLAKASYDQASARADLAARIATEAVVEADRTAPIADAASLAAGHGTVELFVNDGREWRPAETGASLPVGARLRTGLGHAAVALPDGSRIELAPGAELALEEMTRDRRTELRTTRLALASGELTARIAAPGNPASSLQIAAQQSVATADAGLLRLGIDPVRSVRASQLEGTSAIFAAGQTVALTAGQGTVVRDNKAPTAAATLPAAPALAAPENDTTLAAQQVALAWTPVPGPVEAAGFRIDIATDDAFIAVTQTLRAAAIPATTEVLAPGTYFWRVAPIHPNGLVGPVSDTGRFTVERRLRVAIVPSQPPLKHQDAEFVGPMYLFSAQPSDEATSVVSMEYQIDESGYAPLVGSVRLEAEGARVLRVRGVGADGERGKPDRVSFIVDATPPETELAVGVARYETSGTATFPVTLTARDDAGIDRIEVSLNGEPFRAYTEPLTLSTASDALVKFRAVDKVANSSPIRSVMFPATTVPRTAP